MGKYIGIFIVLIVVLIVGSVILTNRCEEDKEEAKSLDTFVISINPEVLLVVNSEEKIEHFELLNEEANIAFSDDNFVGEDLLETVDQILDTSYEMGYLDEYLEENVVSFVTDGEKYREKIEERVKLNLTMKAINGRINYNQNLGTLKTEADEKGITVGKLVIIKRAIAADDTLNEADLLDMSIREIMTLFSSKMREVRSEIINRYNEADMQAIRNKIREETRIIRDQVLESYESLKEMTPEERKIFIEENGQEIREKIREKVEELKEEHGDSLENVRGRWFNEMENFGPQLPIREINEEINTIRIRVLDELESQNLTPAERREILNEVQEAVQTYYEEEGKEAIEQFRERIANQIINKYGQ